MLSSDADEFFGKTLSVHDPADNEPCDEAFVRELLPETKRTPGGIVSGCYDFRFGEIEWHESGGITIWCGDKHFSPADITRRQLRSLVNAMKGE